MRPVIRAITEQDYIEMMDGKPQYTLRGFASELDGRVLGIAGVLHSRPFSAFSKLKPEMKQHKRSIIEAIGKFRGLLSSYKTDIVAAPEETEESADRFLTHVGFVKQYEGLYLWPR